MDSNFGSINYFNCKDPASNYKCKYCDFTTDLWITLNHHIWRRHKSFHDYSKIDSKMETYSCENCKFTSYSILVWHLHVRTCTYVSKSSDMIPFYINREKFFCCKLCEYKSIDGHEFQFHILRPHTEHKSFNCNQCKYKARMQGDLNAHIRRWHDSINQMRYYCSQCTYKCVSDAQLKNHVIIRHTDPKEINWFTCNQCKYKTKTIYTLNRHLKRKHRDFYDHLKRFKCSYCFYKTRFKANLKKHVNARHTDPEEIEWRQCDRCGFKTKEGNKLKRHINVKHVREDFVH